MTTQFTNPFNPGAGHMPPFLAGRDKEKQEFLKLLDQKTIHCNLILTGQRGVGKTVLLDTFKSLAVSGKWLWVGTALSESSTSVGEEIFAQRLLVDLSALTAGVIISKPLHPTGLLNYVTLMALYKSIPGLVSDKLKGVLEFVWEYLKPHGVNGVIFACDDAQTISDYPAKEQYPLSLLLDVFHSIQMKNIPYLLVLVGLPTLLPKLVEARTFAERMFSVVTLSQLSESDCKDAISKSAPEFDEASISLIYRISGGYPYFVQFICKEVFDIWAQQHSVEGTLKTIPINEIIQKLDNDFFAGRWSRATDRQRDLLSIIAKLENSGGEFTVQEIVVAAKLVPNPFGPSQVNQMLSYLSDSGLIHKNRYGKYSFAVPLLGQFILRQEADRTQSTLT